MISRITFPRLQLADCWFLILQLLSGLTNRDPLRSQLQNNLHAAMFSWAATFDEYFIQALERSWEQTVQLQTSVIMKNVLVWCSLSL